jgi:hypothetical protein
MRASKLCYVASLLKLYYWDSAANGKMENIWNEALLAYIKIMFRDLLGEPKKN